MKILFLCLGNICRSPLAEGILAHKMIQQGIKGKVDSAGFESYHMGDPPDPRAIGIALQHQIDISAQRVRVFHASDFDTFDRIYVMDESNMSMIRKKTRNQDDLKKVDFVMNLVYPGVNMEVPDPYYGNVELFEEAYRLLDLATDELAKHMKSHTP